MQSYQIKQRAGTNDQGVRYEIKICALMAIRCLDTKENIHDFWIVQNIDDVRIGNFDDVIIHVEYIDGTIANYCMQLKHFEKKERKRELKLANFCKKNSTSSKNPFNLLDYYRSVTKNNSTGTIQTQKKHRRRRTKKKFIPKQEHDKIFNNTIKYIIFTNKPRDENEQSFVPCCENYCYLLNVGGQTFKITSLQLDEIEFSFLENLTVFCNQEHEENLNNVIKHHLQTLYNLDSITAADILIKYIQYITDWRYGYYGGYRILSKAEIQMKLAEILIDQYTLQLSLDTSDVFHESVSENWLKITNKFKVVLIQDYDLSTDVSKRLIDDCETLLCYILKLVLKQYTTITDWSSTFSTEDEAYTFARFTEIVNMEEFDIYWGNSNIKKLTLQKLHYFLWIHNKLPLILKSQSNEDLKKILNITKFSSNQCIIIHKEYTSEKIDDAKILIDFYDLEDDSKQLILNSPMFIQGKNTLLKKVFPNPQFQLKLLTAHIAQILMNRFQLDNRSPKLPEIFINRTLSPIFLNANIFGVFEVYFIICECEDMLKEYFDIRNAHLPETNVVNWHSIEVKGTEVQITDLMQFKIITIQESDLNNVIKIVKKEKVDNISFQILKMENSEDKIITKPLNLHCKQMVNVIFATPELFYAFLNENSIKYDSSEIYDISAIDFQKIPFTCKYILSGKNKNLFKCNTLNLTLINLHFYKLFFSDNYKYVLEWLGSHGNCNKIREFQTNHDNKTEAYFKYKDCFKYNNLNLIFGPPGIGKSILMRYLFRISPPNIWTVLINFNDYWKYFNNEKFTEVNIIDHIKNFVVYHKFGKSTKNFFDIFLNNKQVCLLFDGFDEIDYKLEDKICQFLKSIIDYGFIVFITCRSVKKNYLELNLNCIARKLLPFTKKDQLDYISNTFKLNILNCDESIEKYTEKLLDSTQLNISAWDKQFCGNPLQIKMISDLYLENCETFCISGQELSVQFVDLLYLYEQFIYFKIKHLEIKDKIEEPRSKQYFEIAIKRSLNNHMICAIKALFPDNKNFVLTPIEDFIQEIKDGLDKIGLIDRINENGLPVFVHRTFAEYLVGLYMSQNLSKEVIKDLLIEILNNPAYDVIRNIFDRLLAVKCPLHTAFLNRDEDKFSELLKTDREIYNIDSGGRTILHLIMSWGARHKIPHIDVLDSLGENGDWKKFTFTLNDIYTNYREQNDIDSFMKLVLGEITTDILFQTDIILNDMPLDYSINVLTLKNVHYYLNVVLKLDENFKDVEKSLKLLNYKKVEDTSLCQTKIHRSISSPVADYKEVLFLSSLYDYSNIVSAIFKLKTRPVDIKYGIGEMTLLHIAARYNSYHVINVLALEGCDLNAIENIWNRTPIFIASSRGNVNAVKLLLERGANIKLTDKYEHTPLYSAVMNHHELVSEMLLNSESRHGGGKTKITKLFAACASGNLGEINVLLAAGEDVNETSQGGTTPFMVSCIKGNVELAKLLLEHEAEIDCKREDGRTGLMFAVQEGHVDVVKFLLSKGADANMIDRHGSTALSISKEYNRLEITKMLQQISGSKKTSQFS